VGKIVYPTFREIYQTSSVKIMALGFDNQNLEFLKSFGEKKWRKCAGI